MITETKDNALFIVTQSINKLVICDKCELQK